MNTRPNRWSTLASAALMLVLILVGSACANRTVTESGTTSEQRVYDVRGQIVEISPDRGQIIVAHEEIPGYMMAMTMPFNLKAPLEAEFEAGQSVAFRYVVAESSFHAEGVRRLSPDEAAALVLEKAPEYTAPSAASLYQMDAKWVNQNGALTRLIGFTGNPVVLSMIFTNCGYACPMIVADMKQIASKLPEDVAGDVQYVLVSLDPERDTPQAMSQFAAAYGLTDQWTMLRGSPTMPSNSRRGSRCAGCGPSRCGSSGRRPTRSSSPTASTERPAGCSCSRKTARRCSSCRT